MYQNCRKNCCLLCLFDDKTTPFTWLMETLREWDFLTIKWSWRNGKMRDCWSWKGHLQGHIMFHSSLTMKVHCHVEFCVILDINIPIMIFFICKRRMVFLIFPEFQGIWSSVKYVSLVNITKKHFMIPILYHVNN